MTIDEGQIVESLRSTLMWPQKGTKSTKTKFKTL